MHKNAPQNIWTSIFHQDLMNIMLFWNMSKPQPILDNQIKKVCIAVIQTFSCVPGMALIQSETNWPQVFTAKCSEPQASIGDDMGGGSGVAILLSVRTETWYKAKWWMIVLSNYKSKR